MTSDMIGTARMPINGKPPFDAPTMNEAMAARL
jgi:hypothetical protein